MRRSGGQEPAAAAESLTSCAAWASYSRAFLLRSASWQSRIVRKSSRAPTSVAWVAAASDARTLRIKPTMAVWEVRIGQSFRQRQVNNEFTAKPEAAAARLDSAAVQLSNPLDQCQADAEPTLGPSRDAINLREHFEYLRHRLGSDSDSIVFDR